MPQAIRIRVGASLDAGALSVFVPLEKAAARAATNITTSLNRGAKATQSLPREGKVAGDKLERELERMANKILRDEQKAEQGRVKSVRQAAAQRVRDEKAANREIEQDLARHRRERAAQDRAIAREQARSAREPSILDKRWWKAPRGQIGLGRRAAIGVSRATSIAYGLGGSVISGGLGLAQDALRAEGLETSFAPHLSNAVALKAQTTDIVNAGYIPGASGPQGQLQSSAKVLEEIQDAGIKTATSFEDRGEGLRAFVGWTGDLQTGRDTMLDLAKIAKATNSNFVDMSKEAAEISNHLGDIPDKGNVTLAVIRAIAGQGKLGAVEGPRISRARWQSLPVIRQLLRRGHGEKHRRARHPGAGSKARGRSHVGLAGGNERRTVCFFFACRHDDQALERGHDPRSQDRSDEGAESVHGQRPLTTLRSPEEL